MRRSFRPLTRAVALSSWWIIPLLAVLAWNPALDFWRTIEPPKAQCEAYDLDILQNAAQLNESIYARAKIDRLVREPQNTLSNAPYAIVGIALLIASRRPATAGLGCALIFLGFGSGMYHAALQPEWRMIDILGVYAVLYGIVWVGWCHHWASLRRRRWSEAAGTVLTWAAAIWTGVHRNDVRVAGFKLFDSTYVFVAAVTLGCVLLVLTLWRAEHSRSRLLRPLTTMLVVAPLSFAGGIGDRFGGFWAAPEALIQGHSVWHAFGAMALLAAYEVYAAAGFDRSTLSLTSSPTPATSTPSSIAQLPPGPLDSQVRP